MGEGSDGAYFDRLPERVKRLSPTVLRIRMILKLNTHSS